MTTLKLTTLAALAAIGLATGCSTYDSTSTTTAPAPVYGGVGGGYTTQMGRVTNIELVDAAQRPGLGTVLGAVVGAALGNQVGSGTGRVAATGAGAVAGGVIGHQMEKRNAADVYRVTVRFDNGATQSFNFDQIGALRIGDRVRFDGSQLYLA
jgi:outer membrane lipoprotein SlyB